MIRISVTNEVLNKHDETFTTINPDSVDDITMDNCRNIVAMILAKKAFKDSGKHSKGMWTAEFIDTEY